MTEDDKMRIDYERTAQYFFHLADVRFKLLALLPLASGAAIALVPEHLTPIEALALGILGIVTTFGLLLYDQRNSQIYNSLIGRANMLEALLQLPTLRSSTKKCGGPFIDRPGKDSRRRILFALPAKHDIGLALVYSASLGAWAFIIVASALRLLGHDPQSWHWVMLAPVGLVVLMFINLVVIDAKSDEEGKLPMKYARMIDLEPTAAQGGE